MTASDSGHAGPDGVLVIDKPSGMTSHDVVDAVRRQLGTTKVGHAGTLDPDATGVLVIGVGRATRLLTYAQRGPKRYTAVARLGITTDTQDASGEVVAERPVGVTREQLEQALESFRGTLMQTPPMVSAVKVGGERLYKKARRGEVIERAERPITIHSLVMDSLDWKTNEVTLDITCSAGTYVRTLVHDLGQRLSCGAHLASLGRTEASGFTERDALPLDAVKRDNLLPVAAAVKQLPRLDVDEEVASHVFHGRPLSRALISPVLDTDARETSLALFHEQDVIAVYRAEEDRLIAERVIAA